LTLGNFTKIFERIPVWFIQITVSITLYVHVKNYLLNWANFRFDWPTFFEKVFTEKLQAVFIKQAKIFFILNLAVS